MKFKVGEVVYHSKLQRNFVVHKIIGDGVYEIISGSFRMRVSEIEITSQKYTRQTRTTIKIESRGPKRGGKSSLDLHGKSVREAKEAILQFVNDCLLSEKESATIVHGKGEGALRECVHSTLLSIRTVARFELDPLNFGQTKVWFT